MNCYRDQFSTKNKKTPVSHHGADRIISKSEHTAIDLPEITKVGTAYPRKKIGLRRTDANVTARGARSTRVKRLSRGILTSTWNSLEECQETSYIHLRGCIGSVKVLRLNPLYSVHCLIVCLIDQGWTFVNINWFFVGGGVEVTLEPADHFVAARFSITRKEKSRFWDWPKVECLRSANR